MLVTLDGLAREAVRWMIAAALRAEVYACAEQFQQAVNGTATDEPFATLQQLSIARAG